VDNALRLGLRGLPGGPSLARLLSHERGVRGVHNPSDLPRLTAEQVLAWADDHHGRAGSWPTAACGPVAGAPEENWRNIDTALRLGLRGLPAGSSLARLLDRERGVRNLGALPRLRVALVLEADLRKRRAYLAGNPAAVQPVIGFRWAVRRER
jgi:hypothetical protein